MKYKQLTFEQRIEIHALLKAGCRQTKIAQIIGVNKSTVSREIKRNMGQRGYRPIQVNHHLHDDKGWKMDSYSSIIAA